MGRFALEDKAAWKWTRMIMQPDWVATEQVHAALVTIKRRNARPALDRHRLGTFREWLYARML